MGIDSKMKQMITDLYKMATAEDEKVVDDKEQYSREDDEGADSDGEDAETGGEGGGTFKVKSMAALMKKKMMGV